MKACEMGHLDVVQALLSFPEKTSVNFGNDYVGGYSFGMDGQTTGVVSYICTKGVIGGPGGEDIVRTKYNIF